MLVYPKYFKMNIYEKRQFNFILVSQLIKASMVSLICAYSMCICNGYRIWINKTNTPDYLIPFIGLYESWGASPESWHLSRV